MGNTNDIIKPFTNNGPLFFSEHKIIAKQLIFYDPTLYPFISCLKIQVQNNENKKTLQKMLNTYKGFS